MKYVSVSLSIANMYFVCKCLISVSWCMITYFIYGCLVYDSFAVVNIYSVIGYIPLLLPFDFVWVTCGCIISDWYFEVIPFLMKYIFFKHTYTLNRWFLFLSRICFGNILYRSHVKMVNVSHKHSDWRTFVWCKIITPFFTNCEC